MKKKILVKLTNKSNLRNLSFLCFILFLKKTSRIIQAFLVRHLFLKIGQQKVTIFCPSD